MLLNQYYFAVIHEFLLSISSMLSFVSIVNFLLSREKSDIIQPESFLGIGGRNGNKGNPPGLFAAHIRG